ncbi:MAG: F0F1 ATP synthase subunit B [Gemmatimonadota bacterium]|nr:F0F1 ATP synthase subunit B [Gemmatimonadota bacterium]
MKNVMRSTGAALLVLSSPAALAAQEGGGWDRLFAVDWGLSFWTVLTFGALLFVLTRFAWKPLLGALDAREASIRATIEDARRLKEEGEALAAENRQQLAEARRNAQQIIAESREAADRVRKEIEEQARAEGQALLERARREIERERDSAIEALRKESVELALSAASRLIQRNLDSESDRALVMDYLNQLEKRQGAQA